MNKSKKLIIALSICIVMFCSCDKDTEPYTEYPVPEWTVESPWLMPNSFTAIVAIPDNISIYARDDDKIAAFINDECRGIGTLVKSEDGTKQVYYITIRASDAESGEIIFKYYNARLAYLYQSKQTVAFETDGTYGTYDSPVILDLEYL